MGRLAIYYIEAGDTIDDFLLGFPSVTREHVVAFLERTATLAVHEILRSLKAKSNRVGDLVVLLPELLQAIPSAPKGTVTTVGSGRAQ
jgi:hypothetical protein